ncbi:MAG TPA: anti-phage dCTP deaminase [Thermoanaerobaculia bacterium]|nr:anti-phage dCTP deaminase [Thermoanaerobaculia bacterium]
MSIAAVDLRDTAERELELIFALAGPVGSDLQEVSRTLADALKQGDYAEVEEISVSALIRQIAARQTLTRPDGSAIDLIEEPEEKRVASHMDAGNAIRRLCASPTAVAAAAVGEIRGRRRRAGGKPSRRAYIIRSLKRPEEVHLLRRVYGPGFFLVGVNVNRPTRVESLAKRIARSHRETPASPHYEADLLEAETLAKRDEDEEWDEYGQRLRDVFQLCDLFVAPAAKPSLFEQIFRFVRLILGDLGETPLPEEQSMYQAFAASLGSGALGRQVGAVLVAKTGEMLGIGWNDVPKAGGGLYRAGEHYDRRDLRADRDTVNVHADQIIEEVLDTVRRAGWLAADVQPQLAEARAAFRKSRIMSLLEFGRTTHAEMEAVLAASRIGASVRDATLYTTTFPCHECARQIVAAGVHRVVYIEPYPKSRALELHRDAIHAYDDDRPPACGTPGCTDLHAVRFEPFLGVGPHRYVDLFSITSRAGILRDRKQKASGERIRWDPKTSRPKVEMLPLSYLDLEAKALYELKKLIVAKKDGR